MSMKSSDFGPRDYTDGRTKQAFRDECDINKILKKAQRTGSIAHLQKYPEAIYGEFDGEFDLLTAQNKLIKANQIFDELPSEVRREFGNDALAFVKFAGDPKNDIRELIPAIAKPGDYFPNPVHRGAGGAGAATPEAAPVAAQPASPPAGDAGGSNPPAAD